MFKSFRNDEPFVNQRIMVDNHGQILEIGSNDFLREYGVTWTDEIIWKNDLTDRHGKLKPHVNFLFKKEAEYWNSDLWSDRDKKFFGLKEQQILMGDFPSLYLKFIDDVVGHGIYANQKIQKDDLIGEYTGEFMFDRRRDTLDSGYLIGGYSRLGRFKWHIDARNNGNYTRFINHSCDPNIKLTQTFFGGQYRGLVIAAKDIKLGEQVLMNYGNDYWSGKQTPVEL
jgi:hypothetical protein